MMKTPLEKEIYSRLWFTYRKDFEPLWGNNNAKYTSDCGWGCMLRTGQMLVAQGLLQHTFGTDWSLYTSLNSSDHIATYREIISFFNDRPDSIDCPFGIHNLLSIADRNEAASTSSPSQIRQSSSRLPQASQFPSSSSASSPSTPQSRVGTWFGPTSVCMLMRDAINAPTTTNKLLKSVKIYVAQDCTVYKQDVINLCALGDKFTPCILLVPVRLGGESINDIYIDSLKLFFQLPYCIGMIGGKPKHSLYFIGYQS